VVLFASGDSITSAELRSIYPRSLRTATELKDPQPYDWLHIASALSQAGEFDIVHNHAGEPAMAMGLLTSTPMLSTLHCLITPDTKIVWQHYRGYYNTISEAALRTIPADVPRNNFVGAVYNGIDVASFPFRADKEEHLLFLSRIAPEKGTHLAIEAARRLGRRLLIAGKVDRVDREYFRTEVEPLLDDDQIRYLGEATREQTKALMAEARALLMPIVWEEPFGLAMVEAMATGTPVIAFARGAAPELIVDGETGFLVPSGDVEAMAAAVGRLDEIAPHRCREHVQTNFDVSRMVDRYVATYEQVLFREKGLSALTLPERVPASGMGSRLSTEPPGGLREAS
jgi:glycosyltransferase involved in cell wall biosynthesis